MKRLIPFLIFALLIACTGCAASTPHAQIAATTLPVYEFTALLCEGTGLSVTRLVTENVSCLHDYTLNVRQVKAMEEAALIVISGGGLEDFLSDALPGGAVTVDASAGMELEHCEEAEVHHDHDHGHDHHHETDPHIWLNPEMAMHMAENICAGLVQYAPEHTEVFQENLTALLARLEELHAYGREQLSALSCRELVTFHDGFAYFAEAFDLTVLEAVEEESGSEASAQTLKRLCGLVWEHRLPAVFTEQNGSVSAAGIIAAETGIRAYALDMAMSGDSYFDAMYRNIDTVKEAMG